MGTPYGVEKVPRLLCPRPPSCIAAALRDHPLRTPYAVENMPPTWCRHRATPARPCDMAAYLVMCLLCVLCCTVLYCAVLCCDVLCCGVLRCVVLCWAGMCVLCVVCCECLCVYVCMCMCALCCDVLSVRKTRVRRGWEENQNPTKHVGKKTRTPPSMLCCGELCCAVLCR